MELETDYQIMIIYLLQQRKIITKEKEFKKYFGTTGLDTHKERMKSKKGREAKRKEGSEEWKEKWKQHSCILELHFLTHTYTHSYYRLKRIAQTIKVLE